MKTQMVKMFALIVLGICLLTPRAWSHDLWLNMTDYTPALWQHPKYALTPRAKTVVYFGGTDQMKSCKTNMDGMYDESMSSEIFFKGFMGVATMAFT